MGAREAGAGRRSRIWRLCLRCPCNSRRDVMSLGQCGTEILSTGGRGSHGYFKTTATIEVLQRKLTFSWVVPDRQVRQHRAQPLTRLWVMMTIRGSGRPESSLCHPGTLSRMPGVKDGLQPLWISWALLGPGQGGNVI